AWLQNPAAGHNDWPLWINLKGRSGSSIPTVDERRRSNLRPDLTLADRSGLDLRKDFAFSRHLPRASRHRKQLRDAIRNLAPFHRHYPESVRRRLHDSFNSVALSSQRQRGKAHRTPPAEPKTKPAPSRLRHAPSSNNTPRHFMQAEASFPTAITACSISGDHGLL
ncbi:hypothetical protein, partial [Burkholderia cepacia]|uniref:hypothetical protein n=1 Tax=Burkholderia cepacia TaxID=292 RepID=UPI002ABE716A